MLEFRKKLAEKKEASKGIAKAGFTLIELLVVLVILGILVLLAAPRFLGYSQDAQVSAMQADAKVLANSALIYHIESPDAEWPVLEDVVEVNGLQTKSLDSDEFKDHVQSLKNGFEEYALVTEAGTSEDGIEYQEGDIVHKTGVEDSKGNTHYGVVKTDAE